MNAKNHGRNEFAEHDAVVRCIALRRFRKRGRTRKALLVVPVLLAGWLVSLDRKQQVAPISPVQSAPVVVSVERPEEAAMLTDTELLAAFPAGSCFVAEVNGRKLLVFNDPALKARVLN